MRHSDTIAAVAAALVKARAQVGPARKDGANPYFKSRYPTLEAVLEAVNPALGANGLTIVQFPVSAEAGVGVETVVLHESGEWIAGEFVLPVSKEDAQGGASCITYARRYAIESVMCLAREDDDGNAAADSLKKLRETALAQLHHAAKKGLAALEHAWKGLSADARLACQRELAALKEEANGHATAK